jgi:acyl transferase domain-containing protein/short-subunit dehydrogenase/acyl carrier protein
MPKNKHSDNKLDILNEPIAIVGVNCQFPGIDSDIEDVDAFHDMLLSGQTPVKDVPINRWDINQYYDPDRQKDDKIVSRKGGFLDDPRLFDANFFKIPPVEAQQIDPQHRLFLEVSIRALNHANITLDSLKNSLTGVYCGISTHDYSQLNHKDKIQFNAYTYIGSANSAAAGRLSYFLNLKGPCLAVDTACSSSLSALYLGTMALRTRQCNVAIVGGVHLSLCPEVSIGLSRANMLSARGESRSFDAKADGYVRSEGCAVVIIKRLSDAIKDRNKIHAVIKSVVMNQDGAGTGIAAPNVDAQIAMHQAVLEQANLTAGDIDYIEAHGTGTVLGDAVELKAIQLCHQDKHSKDKPLIIGALKSNLGHTISASGLAALVKVIGSFKHEIIPPNLHYSESNGVVAPQSIPAHIPLEAVPFPNDKNKKRYAQLSNFGFSGTNVSAIIEEPPLAAWHDATPRHKAELACFVISANSEFSLRQLLKSHLHYLKTSPAGLSEVCHTLINCRDHYKFRYAITAEDKASLINKIESGDFAFKKTIIKKEVTLIGNDARQIYQYFLEGANIRSDQAAVNPVDLPLYVFDRKPYWHEARTLKETQIADDWCFQLEWQYQLIEKNTIRKSGYRWLLAGEASGDLGQRLQGLTLVREQDNYSLEDLDGIIFAEGFDSQPTEDIDLRIDRQKNTLKKLLAMMKIINDKAIKPRLIVLTAHGKDQGGTDTVNLESSPLKGFCKTLCLELPHHQTILLELDKNEGDKFAKHLLHEIDYNHGQHYEHRVSYRDGKRWVSRLKRTLPPTGKPLLHPEGRYLITGGCGGLGLVSAQALLSAGAKELVLISRTVDAPAVSASIKKMQLNYPHCCIRPISLDISDKVRLQKLLLEINEDGLLKGIIHAAGISMNKPLLDHQEEDIDNLFAAKVKGAWYLHCLTQNYDLDFFVVYSSISSVFGSNKESVYSATNSFLDDLIAERQRLGLVGTAIQWGPWADVGMAVKRSRDKGLKDALIHSEQGLAFIQRFINSNLSHVTLISPAYLLFMLDFVPELPPAFYTHLLTELPEAAPSPIPKFSPWLRDYSELNADEQLTTCKSLLAERCKAVLGIASSEDLDDDEGFFEIGLDSLMMAELAGLLKEDLKPLLHVAATIAFDYPSINKLARHIQSELSHHFIKTHKTIEAARPFDESIAIIGMSCSLPNAPDIAAFEQLLENGLSGIKDIPAERWDHQLYYDPDPDAPGKTNVNKLGLIDNIKSFDPHFFGISPREAPFLEPQQRLFLVNCYHAMENANYPAQSLRGSLTGVFAGVGSSHEYYTLLEKNGFSHEEPGMFSITGKALNIIPGRVAYTFDFKGPALSIDTACSSSLVSIHHACNSLKNREIDFALAGGVNILLRPEGVINLSKAKALSPDGQCKTFDANADGYVRSEGCGVLFLKRMTEALRDKDTILAVIKGSAVNHDGKSAGLTVPNGKSQEEVMAKALSQTRLASCDVSYIEAHGTGTTLGDPLEVHAINAVYGQDRGNDNPLYIGTVKTNIGHLESASGVAGVIKVCIGLQKKRIYKNLNFNRLNPNINLDKVQIALHNREWVSNSGLKSAGVSAFGFSGTNAHIILQEFSENTLQKDPRPRQPSALVLSAKSPVALDNLVKRYQQFLATTAHDFTDLCFTAATCRDHHPYRLAVVAKDAHEASQRLKNSDYACSHGNAIRLDLQDDAELNWLVSQYLQGKHVDWATFFKRHREPLTKVALPNYTFAQSEFWLEIKDKKTGELIFTQRTDDSRDDKIRLRKMNRSDSIGYEAALEHLYVMKWSALNSSPLVAANVPELWVITNDERRASKLLRPMKYQIIDTIDKLDKVDDKNIIFLYEQDKFYDLFYCCQTLFKTPPASFILVTENAYAIHGSPGKVNPHHTMASTFWKSFKNELELHRNYTIDLDAESTLRTSLDYLFSTAGRETQFAVRDALYVPRLKKKSLSINSIRHKWLFDSEASYLITGGTGGLAKPLIEYLIRHGAKHLVITSRAPCSLATQRMIESAGKQHVDITHYSADASNLQQMAKILERIGQSSRPLKGVFHLAGVAENDLIVNLGKKELQQVLSAKMESALVLHQLTTGMSLDLFVLFSSASSILGSRRQANYAAANGFLDGLAHLRRHLGLPALAINWGVFHTIGMAATTSPSLEKRGFIPLDEQSIDILDHFLQSDLSQIIVCPMQWDLYFKNTPKDIVITGQGNENRSPDKPLSSFLQQQSPKERHAILSQALCDIAADVLGLDVEQVGRKNDLFAMGMDSLMALELRSRVHDKLQCPNLNLPIEYFVNDPRIDKITSNIEREFHRVVAQTHVKTSVKEVRAAATPLSDTQYGFWVVDKMGSSFNCPKQIQLHGQLNRDYLVKAFTFTVNQNGAFWLNFHKDIPIQMPRRQGQFTVFYEDISAGYDQDTLNELFYENTMQTIELTCQPLIRVYLYKLKEDLHELHIIIPHIILDEASYRILFAQFKYNYETLLRGKRLIPVQEETSYLDYVKQNNEHYETNLQDKIDFWQVYNKGFQKLSFGRAYHVPDAARELKNLRNYQMDEQLVEKFKAWHKEKNINVSTGLIAAFHIVFYKISSQKKIPVMILHNGREGSRYDSIVGLFLEYKRINITLDEHYKFMDFFKFIEDESIKAAPFQQCSHYIKNAGLKESRFSIGQKAMTLYHKILLSKKFKVSYPNSVIRPYYLKILSKVRWFNAIYTIKDRVNRLIHTDLRLLKPHRLTVVFNITAGFFIKQPRDNKFADLEITIPNHFGSMDRPIGNQTLWIFFTKDQFDQYRLSINGPLSTDCKDLIAQELNKVMAKIMENDEYRIIDLISNSPARLCRGSIL